MPTGPFLLYTYRDITEKVQNKFSFTSQAKEWKANQMSRIAFSHAEKMISPIRSLWPCFFCVNHILAIVIHAWPVAFDFSSCLQKYTNLLYGLIANTNFFEKNEQEKICHICNFGRGICWMHGEQKHEKN